MTKGDILLFNPYHDRLGRFGKKVGGAAGSAAGSVKGSTSYRVGRAIGKTGTRIVKGGIKTAIAPAKFGVKVIGKMTKISARNSARIYKFAFKNTARNMKRVAKFMTFPVRKGSKFVAGGAAGIVEGATGARLSEDQNTINLQEANSEILEFVEALEDFMKSGDEKVAFPTEGNPGLDAVGFEEDSGYWVADKALVTAIISAAKKAATNV